MNMHHILVPLDGSSWSHTIIPTLSQMFDPNQYQVTLLRVAEEPAGVSLVSDPLFMDTLAGVRNYPATANGQQVTYPTYDTQVEESRRAALEDALQLAAQPLHAAGFTVATAVRFGDPAGEIVAATKAQPIDLVAMTTHGRRGLRRVLMGSVAEEVMHSVQVPVLLLRPLAQPSERPRTNATDFHAQSWLQQSTGGIFVDERDRPIKDADAEILPSLDEERDHNFAGREIPPEVLAAEASRNPFMRIEEETLPEDFRPLL